MQLFLLGIWISDIGISEEIQIFDLHIDADLRRLMEVGECTRTCRDLLIEFVFGTKRLLGLRLESTGFLGGVELALLCILKVFFAEIIVASDSG